jgi:hypothetical protein
MERRAMLADGLRCLAQVLPTMIATAGSLGFLLRRPVGTVAGSPADCFPAQAEAEAQQTSILHRRRSKDGNKPP